MLKILTICISFFLIASSSDAQLFKAFKAKDGYSAALSEAQKTITSGPQLMFIGTTKQTVNVGIELNIDFNMNDGTSQAWFYLFKDKNIDSIKLAFLVVKPIIGNYIVNSIDAATILNSGLPFNPQKTLNDYAWQNSDSFASKLKADNEFITFYNIHKDSAQFFVALFTNANWQLLEPNQPYWGVIMTDKGVQKACGMHAVNGDLRCGVLSIAEDLRHLGINIYPNPANNQLNINIPQDITYFGEIEIYNSNSLLLTKQKLDNGFGLISIDVNDYPNGFYFAKMNSSKGILTIPFLISK